MIQINVSSEFLTPASVSSLTGFKRKPSPYLSPCYWEGGVTERWSSECSYYEGFLLSWRHPPSFIEASSPRVILEGRRQLDTARGRHRCLLLVKPSWKPAWGQQENKALLMHLPPPFLKRKMGRKPSKALNLFSYSNCVKRSIIPWELGWTQVFLRGGAACTRASRGSLWHISLLQEHTRQSFLVPTTWWWMEEQFFSAVP